MDSSIIHLTEYETPVEFMEATEIYLRLKGHKVSFIKGGSLRMADRKPELFIGSNAIKPSTDWDFYCQWDDELHDVMLHLGWTYADGGLFTKYSDNSSMDCLTICQS